MRELLRDAPRTGIQAMVARHSNSSGISVAVVLSAFGIVELAAPSSLSQSPERTSKQFIQGSYDRIGFIGKRSDTLSQVLVGDRHNLQRMQHYYDSLDLEGRIEARIGNLTEPGLSHERDHNTATIAVE